MTKNWLGKKKTTDWFFCMSREFVIGLRQQLLPIYPFKFIMAQAMGLSMAAILWERLQGKEG